MGKATASPQARRRSGDQPRGMAKIQKHQTQEILPPKCKSVQKNKNNIRASKPFSLNLTGTLSRRHLAQFVSAIDTGCGRDAAAALRTSASSLRGSRAQIQAPDSWQRCSPKRIVRRTPAPPIEDR